MSRKQLAKKKVTKKKVAASKAAKVRAVKKTTPVSLSVLSVFARCVREVMEANPGLSRAAAMRFCSEAFARGTIPRRLWGPEKVPALVPKKAPEKAPRRERGLREAPPAEREVPPSRVPQAPKPAPKPAPLTPVAPPGVEPAPEPVLAPERPKEPKVVFEPPAKLEEETGVLVGDEDVPFPVEGQLVYRRGVGFVMV